MRWLSRSLDEGGVMSTREAERAWLDAIWKETKPLSLDEVKEVKAAWEKWAWFRAHDEDCSEDFQGANSLHLRLVKTIIEGIGER